jgi:hypothetical protein
VARVDHGNDRPRTPGIWMNSPSLGIDVLASYG